MRRTAGLVAIALASTMFLAGCGDDAADKANEKIAESVIEDQGGEDVDVDVDGETVTIEGEDGTVVVGGAGELPDNFPENLPLPEGDYTVSAMTSQGDSFLASIQSEQTDFDATLAALLEDLDAAGYELEDEPVSMSMGEGDTTLLSVMEGDQLVTISLATTPGTPGITVIYAGE